MTSKYADPSILIIEPVDEPDLLPQIVDRQEPNERRNWMA